MIEIFCPFCGEKIVSDVLDEHKKGFAGQWQCYNGHNFVLTYWGITK